MQARGFIIGAKRAAQRPLDPFRHLGKRHLAVKRRKNGAADEGRAAQTCQDSSAKPLHRNPAPIDDRGLGTVDRQRRLVTKIDHPGL